MLPTPHAPAFDLANARQLARYAALAYQSAPAIQAALGPAPLPFFRFIESRETDTQCFVAGNETARIVAFRGTSGWRDCLTDLCVRQAEVLSHAGGARVHAGFLAADNSVRAAVRQALLESDALRSPIFATGHSLGGALAQLDHFQLGWPHQTYTFGSPRVGNAAFAAEANARCAVYRVVHEEDPVPRLPLWTMGYRHAGAETFLSSFGALTFNPPLRYKLLSDACGLINAWSRNKLAAAEDHFIQHYLEALDALAPVQSAMGNRQLEITT